MNRKEKSHLKSELSQYMDLSNSRFKDDEIERLMGFVQRRDEFNGETKTHRKTYKTFDSEDTYRVEETDTYTIHNDESGISIEQDFVREWDDGQVDTEHNIFNTGRSILNALDKMFGK